MFETNAGATVDQAETAADTSSTSISTEAPAQETTAATGLVPASFEDALARLSDDGTSLVDPAAAAAEPTAQPRGEDGKFTAAGTPATDGADASAGEDTAAPETPVEGETPDPAAAAEGAEAEAAADEGDGSAEGEDVFVLALPPRREGEADVDVEFRGLDQQTREDLARMRNGYMRGESFRQEMSQVSEIRDELLDIRDDLAQDPAGFILGHIHESFLPDTARVVLARLWENQEVADQLMDMIEGWNADPAKRAAFLQEQQTASQQRQQERPPVEVRRAGRALNNAILGLIPEGTPQPRGRGFFVAAGEALRAHIIENNLEQLDPKEVPGLLTPLLKGFGFEAPTPKAPPADAGRRTPAAAAAAAAGPGTATATDTGKTLAAASARRRSLTGVAPAGPTPAVTRPTPPPGQTVEQRLAWLEKQP
jgi:hypothetical protein